MWDMESWGYPLQNMVLILLLCQYVIPADSGESFLQFQVSGCVNRLGTAGLVANPFICSAEQSNDATSANSKYSNYKCTQFHNAYMLAQTCIQFDHVILAHFYNAIIISIWLELSHEQVRYSFWPLEKSLIFFFIYYSVDAPVQSCEKYRKFFCFGSSPNLQYWKPCVTENICLKDA